MDDKLLSYYNRELAYIRKMGDEFAREHPKIAGRLRLDHGIVEDPHVSRLIESFSFLTARIRHTIDDSFPELTEALMGVIYPDYHAPVPSFSVVQIRAIHSVAVTSLIEKGRQVTLGERYDVCYYRTIYETKVLPVTVSSSKFSTLPVNAPALPPEFVNGTTQAVLKIRIEPFPDITLDEVDTSSLKFYLSGQTQLTSKLYEYILKNVNGISIARNHLDPEAIFLPASMLTPCGLEDYESAVEFDGRVSMAHRLLTEFFVFSDKFLFIELGGIQDAWSNFIEGFNIYIFFNKTDPELVQGVDENTLLLGCTPVVNLFDSQIETIDVNKIGTESKLRAARQHAEWADIHSIKDVYLSNREGTRVSINPFYGSHLTPESQEDIKVFWHIRRENSRWYEGNVSHGTDTYLSLVDENFDTGGNGTDWLLNADVICTNRDLPGKLPFGPDQPKVDFYEGVAGLRLNCIVPPTQTIQPQLDEATRWQLVSHLSLQSFSGSDGLEVLKETLQLYNFNTDKSLSGIIDGITKLSTQITTARIIQQGRAAHCQGTKIIIEYDRHYDSSNCLYLFSRLLSEFFSQMCTINSFTQLTVKLKRQNTIFVEWPAKAGRQMLS